MIKKRYLFLLFVLVLGLVLVVGLTRKQKKAELTINFKNVSSVTVSELTGEHDDEAEGSTEPATKITQSGTKLSLKDDEQYLLSYRGAEGYTSDQQIVSLSGDKTINLNPYYSSEKLKEMLATETPAIQAALKEKYQKIGLYSIQPGELYLWGDWYGTTLVYSGPYTPYRDTLRVVMKKSGGKWMVATDPPYISLSKYSFPDIPIEVLNGVNNQSTPKPKSM